MEAARSEEEQEEMFKSTRHKLAAAALVGAVTLGAGGAVAWAQTTGGSPTTAPAPSAPTTPAPSTPSRGHADLGAVARRAVHGDLVVKDKTGAYVTVTFDRGTVTAASATSITLSRADGQSTTLTINATTKVRGVTSVGALQTGKPAVVTSRNATASQIFQKPAN